MATEITRTPASYDYDDLMDSFVIFMKAQDEWKDYDFDGSGLRQIMRLLSYNTQQQGLQNNMLMSESFMDSAQIKENVESFASGVQNYLAKGKTASRIVAKTIVVVPDDLASAAASIVLEKDVTFYAAKDSRGLTFSPLEEYQAELIDGKYTFNSVVLVQGSWGFNSFVAQANSGVIENFVLPNKDVDISTLSVFVKPNSTSTIYDTFTKFRDAYDLGPTRKLFYVRKNRQGFYEIEFGDGSLSYGLEYGNVIVAEILTTDGSIGNGIRTLSPSGAIGGNFNIELSFAADAISYGGTDGDSIEKTKFFAPLHFETRGGAVTDPDYITVTKEYFPSADDVISWGGELNRPPKYGYTFIAVKPNGKEFLSSQEKTDLFNILKERNVGSITPIIIDPSYFYINVDSTVRYNPYNTMLTATVLATKITNRLRSYSASNLERFNSEFDISVISQYINSVDKSIKGNRTVVTYERRFIPELNASFSYEIMFNQEILPGSVVVKGFRVSDVNAVGYTFSLVDRGDGTMYMIKSNGTITTQIMANAASINYTTGLVKINQFRPSSLDGGYVYVVASPKDSAQVYVSSRNDIVKFNSVSVEMDAVNRSDNV